MIQYPQTYDTSTHAQPGIDTYWSAQAADLPEIKCAIPPEFHGPGAGYSPEELYALALSTCFIATFKVIAEKSRALFTDINAEAQLTVDRDDRGLPWMSKVDFDVVVSGAQNRELIERLLEKTSHQCMILNSVKTELNFSFKVS